MPMSSSKGDQSVDERLLCSFVFHLPNNIEPFGSTVHSFNGLCEQASPPLRVWNVWVYWQPCAKVRSHDVRSCLKRLSSWPHRVLSSWTSRKVRPARACVPSDCQGMRQSTAFPVCGSFPAKKTTDSLYLHVQNADATFQQHFVQP